jgi:hypothetical protein
MRGEYLIVDVMSKKRPYSLFEKVTNLFSNYLSFFFC